MRVTCFASRSKEAARSATGPGARDNNRDKSQGARDNNRDKSHVSKLFA